MARCGLRFYQRQAALETKLWPPLQVEKKTPWKRGSGGGNQAKLVTFSHDVTFKSFRHKPFSAFFLGGGGGGGERCSRNERAAAPSVFLCGGFLPFCKLSGHLR